MLFSTILLPFLGKLGDSYGIKTLLMISAALVAILAFPFYYLALHGNLVAGLLIKFILVTFLSFHFATIVKSLAGLFPTSIRFTGFSFSWNLCAIFVAGTAPFLSLDLLKKTGNAYIPAILLIIMCMFTFFSLIPLKEKNGELDLPV